MKQPYRIRAIIRKHLPWFLIELGLSSEGNDCEAAGGVHDWYNMDGKQSACYHCNVCREGALWKQLQG